MALVLLVLFAGDGAYTIVGLRDSLPEVAVRLRDGGDALERGDVPAARAHFLAGLQESRRAEQLLAHPAPRLLSVVPWIGRDARALSALARAGSLTAQAGGEAVGAARSLGLGDEGVAASLYARGRVRLDAVENALPFIARAEELVSRADRVLEESSEPLLPALDSVLSEARQETDRAKLTAQRANVLFSALPELLGAEGARTYLLAFQTNSEARGTGGLIGLYGLLQADAGALDLVSVGPIGEAIPPSISGVSGPPWFERSYGPHAALREVRQVNLSPNFPAVADVLLAMYERATGANIDGVIAMDPIAFESLLRGTGSIRAPGLDVEVGPENASDVLLRDAYVSFASEEEQNRYFGALVRNFWSRISGDAVKVAALGEGLGAAFRSQHLKMFAQSREDQQALDDLGAGGSYGTASSNVQMVFHNNYAVNKVDYFLQRSIETSVQVVSEDQARITTQVRMQNTAPAGRPSLLLGPGVAGDPPGLNRMLFSMLLPDDADIESFRVTDSRSSAFRFDDGTHPVTSKLIEIAPGDSAVARVVYDIPLRSGRFELVLFPQATVTPDQFSVTVEAGASDIAAATGLTVEADGRIATSSGSLTEPKLVAVSLEDA